MLIKESQLNITSDSMSLLENMDYLTESESAYYPAMVPVVENTRFGANMIALEDICQFAESNGIVDFGYALQAVCEASQIDPASIAFSVHEENVIADDDIKALAEGIMGQGVPVVAVPLSSNDGASLIAEAAMGDVLRYNDYSLLEAFVNDDFDYMYLAESRNKNKNNGPYKMSDDDKNKMGNDIFDQIAAQKAARAATEKQYTVDGVSYGRNSVGYQMAKKKHDDQRRLDIATKKHAIEKRMADAGGPDSAKGKYAKMAQQLHPSTSAAPALQNAVEKLDTIKKEAEAKPQSWISKKIAAINKWAEGLKARKNAENAGIIASILSKIGTVIAYLTSKLQSSKAA